MKKITEMEKRIIASIEKMKEDDELGWEIPKDEATHLCIMHWYHYSLLIRKFKNSEEYAKLPSEDKQLVDEIDSCVSDGWPEGLAWFEKRVKEIMK